MSVRIARAHQADAIVDLIRSSIPARHVRLSVMGCTGAKRYVRDRIGLSPRDSSVFVVAVDDGRVCGAAEFRRRTDSMFVNHIVVSGEARGRGIGRSLLRVGAQSLRVRPDNSVSLDVFSDNVSAVRWYEGLGLETTSETSLIMVAADGADADMWSADDLLQCRLVLETYGFGACRIVTGVGEYTVGVLDTGIVRTRDAWGDESVVSAVAELWPGSILLSAERDPGRSEPIYSKVFRMVGTIEQMMDSIGER